MAFQARCQQAVKPFEWTFTHLDLHALLTKLKKRHLFWRTPLPEWYCEIGVLRFTWVGYCRQWSRGEQIDDVLDGCIGTMIGGFQLAGRPMTLDRVVVEAAVGQWPTEPFVE